jgi:hypothetical protein
MTMTLLRNWIRKSAQNRRPVTARPCLESLEQRDVPSTLALPQTNLPTFTATYDMTLPNGQTVLVSGQPVAGGNFLGTLNGTTNLVASYCVNINQTIFPGTTYSSATVTTNGTINGTAVPQASAISWLLTNLGPTATTPYQQDALQAAIWRTESGNGFQLDGVDNNNGAPAINSTIAPIYQSDLAALGKNTAPVSSVRWIDPGLNPDSSQGQYLAAITNQTSTQATRTTLQSSLSTATYGQPVTLTATVAPTSGSGTPTGSVTFKDGTVTLGTATLSGGKATFTTNQLGAGSHSLTAVYGGSTTYAGSTSAALTETIHQATTQVSLTSSGTSAVYGQTVTLTAKVNVIAPGGGPATGTVTFKDGTKVLGTATVTNGVAVFKTSSLSLGNHSITAVYGGSSNFVGSTSTTVTETVIKAASHVTLTTSAPTATYGQTITLTAKVSVVAPGAAPISGTVTFKDGSTVLGTVTLSNGVAVFKTSKLSKGKHTLTVVYNGDTDLTGSTSAALIETIN